MGEIFLLIVVIVLYLILTIDWTWFKDWMNK
jgi:uncharacterized protein involved in outer membrane biogenesis